MSVLFTGVCVSVRGDVGSYVWVSVHMCTGICMSVCVHVFM